MHSNRLMTSVFSAIAAVICLATIGVPNFSRPPLIEPTNAVSVPGGTPQACFGFIPVNGKWGGDEHRTCPVNHALYWVGDDAGKEREGTRINVGGTCCPLPSEDILVDQHVYVNEECPDNYVATGGRAVPCDEEFCPVLMRCTKINSARYQLGAETRSKYWGNGHAGWQRSERVDWEAIPVSFRFAVGRNFDKTHDVDGCVGYPWGSLFTKKTSKYCGGNYFRQLQFKGSAGDPQAGIPVKMFADCERVEDPDDPAKARCASGGSQNVG